MPITTTITKTDDFIREVDIRRLRTLEDSFSVKFTSRLLTSKNPNERQNNLELFLDGKGLLELKNAIDTAVAMTVAKTI